MIQRIQSVYLLGVVVLSCLTFFLPVVDFTTMDVSLESSYFLNYKGLNGIHEIFSNVAMLLLAVLTALISIVALVTIFLYKRRMLQIRLTVANMVLMVGYYVLLGVTVWSVSKTLDAGWHLRFVTSFPLINVVLSYLAVRAIGKDEALVRSLNRLR